MSRQGSGRRCDLFKCTNLVLAWGWPQENVGQNSRPRFEPGTSWIQV